MAEPQYRVLLIADVPTWAYARRCRSLAQYAPPNFECRIRYHSGASPGSTCTLEDVAWADVVYNCDYMRRGYDLMIRQHGLRAKLVISHNRDSQSKLERWHHSYSPAVNVDGFVVCNNYEVFDSLGRLPRTCNISNGVDTTVWQCRVPMEQRPKRVIWCGGANPKKGKGYFDILRPMESVLAGHGFDCDFRAFHSGKLSDWAYPTGKQRAWYNGAAIILCASDSEGTPNILLEGMACGCAPVSTNVGNIREYGNGENSIVCERSVDALVKGVLEAWERRHEMSAAARETMQTWAYGEPGHRARWFFRLFERLIEDGADSILPFSYLETPEEDI